MEEVQQTNYAWMGDFNQHLGGLYNDYDLSSMIPNETQRKIERKNYMDKLNSNAETRSMIRYLTIIIDLSAAMKLTDLKPSRLAVTKRQLKKFVKDFFDQNPLSLINILTTNSGKSMMISDFFNSPNEHIEKIAGLQISDGGPSLQNALELSISCFSDVPRYAFKEVLVITGSMIT